MNILHFSGHVVRDPKSFSSERGNCTKYTVAVNRSKDKVVYYNCTAFSRNAEFAEKYLRKGTGVIITGDPEIGRPYKDKNDEWVSTIEVIVASQEFDPTSRSDNANAGPEVAEVTGYDKSGQPDKTKTDSERKDSSSNSDFVSMDCGDEKLPWQ